MYLVGVCRLPGDAQLAPTRPPLPLSALLTVPPGVHHHHHHHKHSNICCTYFSGSLRLKKLVYILVGKEGASNIWFHPTRIHQVYTVHCTAQLRQKCGMHACVYISVICHITDSLSFPASVSISILSCSRPEIFGGFPFVLLHFS